MKVLLVAECRDGKVLGNIYELMGFAQETDSETVMFFVGDEENVALIKDLAQSLEGEYGASRPVVDSEWVEHNRQVGTTGQSVAPKLYVACGISGAIQHLAGMKKSEFIVAINTDRDAPIGEIADVLVVADLKQFVPALTEKIKTM